MNPNLKTIEAQTLKKWLHDGHEIALLDVREHGQYGEEHLFYVTSTPYSKLEAEALRLVPRKDVRLVLIGDDENRLTRRAAQRLAGLGYTQLYLLAGGHTAWKHAGYQVFAGVNLPSKAFGELAEHAFGTPRITAKELNEKIQAQEDLIILDGRPFAEYRKMSIPTATSCPNGELALRIDSLVSRSETTIVVNCAGRTRSIIGAQTLINLGIKNKILALENGTQGWFLANLTLDHGASRRYTVQNDPAKRAAQRARAQALADQHGVTRVTGSVVEQWLSDTTRTTFLCDVRSPEEFALGTVLNAQNTPGGQLIQATDQFIGVRAARLVLIDDDGVRAPAMASWLAMMGWEVAVLTDGFTHAWSAEASHRCSTETEATRTWPVLSAQQLSAALESGARLLDVRASTKYREAHIREAQWSIRPQFEALAGWKNIDVVVLADDAILADLAALELTDLGASRVSVSTDTPQAWRAAGLTVVATPDQPTDAQSLDYLFFVHDRHEGNRVAAQRYLEWEINLLKQLDDQEKQSYRLPS